MTAVSGTSPQSIAVASLAPGGVKDLLLTNQAGSFLSVFPGNGNGTFQTEATYPTGQGEESEIALGDLNGDGILDAAVALYGSANGIAILLGKGDGTFQPATYVTTAAVTYGVTVADFDGDGHLDLAGALLDGTVDIFLGNGQWTFSTPLHLPRGQGTRLDRECRSGR